MQNPNKAADACGNTVTVIGALNPTFGNVRADL